MKVYAVFSPNRGPLDLGRLTVPLRRVGAVLGFLLGLGLWTLITANTASADTRQNDGAASDHPDSEQLDVVAPVTDLVSSVTEGVGAAVEPVAPMAHAGTGALAPVVEPIANAVATLAEPVLRPVVTLAQPVLDAAAPVTEPLAGPLLVAAEPVVGSVSTTAQQDDAVVQQGSLPEPALARAGPVAAAAVTPEVPRTVAEWTDEPRWPAPDGVAGATGSTFRAPEAPGGQPGGPSGPNSVAVGGTAAAGGPGRASDTASAVLTLGSGESDDRGSGRGPPGSIVGTPWFGVADRDYPG